MSHCKRDGKDISVFVTKEDSANPEMMNTLAQDDEYGIILPSGEINWDCPCLGGMAQGPCGQEFKDAFSCFHYSSEEEKGSDCIPQFRGMQECFQKYPEIYSKYADDDEGEERSEDEITEPTSQETGSTLDNSDSSEAITTQQSSQAETS